MSYKSHIPKDVLKNLDRILFVSHLALGDFTYLQQFLKKLSSEYPNLKIDLLIDDVRRTRMFWRWKYLKKYLIYDWVKECYFLNKVYTDTYSPGVFKRTIDQAREQLYPITVSLCTLRSHKYAKLARFICPRGFVVGVSDKELQYLDATISSTVDSSGWHITDLYALWFKQLFGIELSKEEVAPKIDIPEKWLHYGRSFISKSDTSKMIFINIFAKTKKRSWPINNLIEIVQILTQEPQFSDTIFVINSPPENFEQLSKAMEPFKEKVVLLRAEDSFFQLPSVIKYSSLVISVETSIIHFAKALNVPLISLMRKKNPEWIPYGENVENIIFASDRKSWVNNIPVSEVIEKVKNSWTG